MCVIEPQPTPTKPETGGGGGGAQVPVSLQVLKVILCSLRLENHCSSENKEVVKQNHNCLLSLLI